MDTDRLLIVGLLGVLLLCLAAIFTLAIFGVDQPSPFKETAAATLGALLALARHPRRNGQ